jgi:hypothetical protein
MKKRRRARAVAATRLSIDPAGDWKACTATLPKGCTVLGTVTIGTDTAALVRLAESKNYVRVKDGQIGMLHQRRIETLLDAATRARTAQEMVPVAEWEQRKTQPC